MAASIEVPAPAVGSSAKPLGVQLVCDVDMGVAAARPVQWMSEGLFEQPQLAVQAAPVSVSYIRDEIGSAEFDLKVDDSVICDLMQAHSQGDIAAFDNLCWTSGLTYEQIRRVKTYMGVAE